MKTLSRAVLILVVSLPLRSASAQTTIDFPTGPDYATCEADMPMCDSESKACCVRSFPAIADDRAILIPLDRCHQTPTGSKFVAPDSASPKWCADPAPGQDDGAFIAYGLVYRLLQAGIPVHWLVNPTKDATTVSTDHNPPSSQIYTHRDIDLWVLGWNRGQNRVAASPPSPGQSLASCSGDCEAPVVRLADDLSPAAAYSKAQFPVRGSAFLIAAEDRARFNELWTRSGEFADRAGKSIHDFSDVDLYELSPSAEIIWQDYRLEPFTEVRGAPLASTLVGPAPRLARQGPAGVSKLWLVKAKLDEAADPSCRDGAWTPSTAVYCTISTGDVADGLLVSGKFSWAWFDNYKDNKPCSNASKTAVVDGFREFLTAVPGVRNAGSVLFQEAAIDVMEGCSNRELMGKKGAGLRGVNQAMSEPFIFRYPSNLYMQFGDYPARFAQGSPSKFTYFGSGAGGYDPAHLGRGGTLRRLVSEDASSSLSGSCSGHQSDPSCDVFANDSKADVVDLAVYTRHEGNPQNGVVFYMAGNQVIQDNNAAHLRMLLNALISTPRTTVDVIEPPKLPFEVARSAPVVAPIAGISAHVQGTWTGAHDAPEPTTYGSSRDDQTFLFPATTGHLRGFDVEVLGGETPYSQLPALFDAADQIPTPNANGCGELAFTEGCRTVFTHVDGGARPARVDLSVPNRSQLAPLLGANLSSGEIDVLISRILAGRPDGSGGYEPGLGGIDRSTVAVIESSTAVGNDRPQMIYAGGLDGMLHAVCGEIKDPCTALGQELWAFIPRTQLPLLRFNTQRIDGSPRVADVVADFDGDGAAEIKTVLVFQTGSGDPTNPSRTPAMIAMDITDPAAPAILWERTPAVVRSEVEPGAGLSLAMSLVKTSNGVKHVTFASTNNGGTGGAGALLQAVETATGEILWSHFASYPMPRVEANPRVPASGIPAGPTALDRAGVGFATHILLPTLFGDLWMFDAASGASVYGTKPLFRFTGDFHPIGVPASIFREPTSRKLHAVVASGGYADPHATSWSPDGVHQYAVAVSLETPLALAPLDENEDLAGYRAWTIDLGEGQRAFAQPVVAGDEIFIVTSRRDANRIAFDGDGGVGTLRRYSLADGSQRGSAVAFGEGAGGIDVDGGAVFTATAGGVARTVPPTAGGSGSSVEIVRLAGSRRSIWLNLSQ